jgi:hypothetical protein
MSAHAETHHGHEGGHNESAVETLFDGITKIMSSVRIAVGKVFNGVKNLLNGLVSTVKASSSHGSHDAHATHPPAHDDHKPAEKSHKEEHKKEGHGH